MRFLIAVAALWVCHVVWSQNAPTTDKFSLTLVDPRLPWEFYTMFEDGKEPATTKLINNSILIIHWMPTPDRAFDKYQISGMEGYHSKEQVLRFLTRFYEMDHQKETKMERPNIILAGNNWGAGMELKGALRELSRTKALGVFYAGGWAFQKVSLIAEPEPRKTLIQRCYKEANP